MGARFDYYIHEKNDEDDESKQESEEIKKEALEAFLKAKDEFKTTKYENIKVVNFFSNIFIYIMRYTIHNIFVKISVFGDDDTWLSNSNSVYKTNGTTGTFNNSKKNEI